MKKIKAFSLWVLNGIIISFFTFWVFILLHGGVPFYTDSFINGLDELTFGYFSLNSLVMVKGSCEVIYDRYADIFEIFIYTLSFIYYIALSGLYQIFEHKIKDALNNSVLFNRFVVSLFSNRKEEKSETGVKSVFKKFCKGAVEIFILSLPLGVYYGIYPGIYITLFVYFILFYIFGKWPSPLWWVVKKLSEI